MSSPPACVYFSLSRRPARRRFPGGRPSVLVPERGLLRSGKPVIAFPAFTLSSCAKRRPLAFGKQTRISSFPRSLSLHFFFPPRFLFASQVRASSKFKLGAFALAEALNGACWHSTRYVSSNSLTGVRPARMGVPCYLSELILAHSLDKAFQGRGKGSNHLDYWPERRLGKRLKRGA